MAFETLTSGSDSPSWPRRTQATFEIFFSDFNSSHFLPEMRILYAGLSIATSFSCSRANKDRVTQV